jgi:hypothetical protein
VVNVSGGVSGASGAVDVVGMIGDGTVMDGGAEIGPAMIAPPLVGAQHVVCGVPSIGHGPGSRLMYIGVSPFDHRSCPILALPGNGRALATMQLFRVPLLIALALVATHRLSAMQRAGSPTVAQKSAPSAFECPDKDSAKACASFLELWRASDEGVRPDVSANGVAYVCFRQPDDEFFVFSLDGPLFQMHFDPETKKRVPVDSAVSRRFGFVRGFKDGIAESSITPITMFSGNWTYIGEPFFVATRINVTNIPPEGDDSGSGINIDPWQVSAQLRYKSRLDKNIDYRLVIQRSTGRFSESYTEESAKVPFSERTGRCSKIPPKK